MASSRVLAFILYYAIPVFNNIMPDKHFKNIIKLIIFMEILLSKEVCVVLLKVSQNLVVEFIDELNDLYPKNIMLSGVHELLHFVEGTLDYGPVNITNLFTYEELNRKIIRLIKGKDLIGEEFIKLFSTAQCLSTVEPSSVELREFLSQFPILRSSNRKNKNKTVNKIKFLSVKSICKDQKYLDIFNEYTNSSINEIFCVNRLQFNNHLYTTISQNTKFCDSCILSSDGFYGIIEDFLYDNVNVFVIARKIVNVFNPYVSNHFPMLKASLFIGHVTEELFLSRIEDIQKCAFIFISEAECYVSSFSISHLFM